MFSYVDLVRAEIAVEVGNRFSVTIPDGETDDWRTLKDVARSVIDLSNDNAIEREVVQWVQTLLVEGYDVPKEILTADADIFGDADQAASWFSAAPYPHSLRDRYFVKRRD